VSCAPEHCIMSAAMRALFIAALLGSAAASASGTIKLTWSDCADSSTHGHITSLTPTLMTLGQDTKLVGSGTIDEEIQAATYKVVSKAGFITVFSHSGDMCEAETIQLPGGAGQIVMKGFKCPLRAGPIELDLDLTLSSTIPAFLARVTIDITATTSSGHKALCIHIKTSPALASALLPSTPSTPSPSGNLTMSGGRELIV
jgi:hypothetical protein